MATRPLTSSHFIVGACIPPSVHLQGKISLVWGKLTSIKWTGHAITFLLIACIPNDISDLSENYTVRTPGNTTMYSIRLLLRPAINVNSDDIQISSRMEGERKQLVGLVAKLVTIDCGGLVVDKVIKENTGTMVHLEGSGERLILTRSGEKIKILSGLSPRIYLRYKDSLI